MKDKVLVTGGAGFIGSHLVQDLVNNGYDVRILDNFSTGSQSNIEVFKGDIDIMFGDILDMETCIKACDTIDHVYHLAALGSVIRSFTEPQLYYETNERGTLNMLKASEPKRASFTFSSSSAVYGDTMILPKEETMKTNPLSPYAETKCFGERLTLICSEFIQTSSLRYFNVFGPRQNPNSQYSAVIPLIIKSLHYDLPFTIYGDGYQTRDFTYVDNIVHANKLSSTKNFEGEIFNVGCGERVSLLELIKIIEGIMTKKLTVVHTKSRKGDVRHSLADVTKISKDMGYQPLVSLEEGLEKTIKWYRNSM